MPYDPTPERENAAANPLNLDWDALKALPDKRPQESGQEVGEVLLALSGQLPDDPLSVVADYAMQEGNGVPVS